MTNFRDVREKQVYELGRSDGYAMGLIVWGILATGIGMFWCLLG